MSIQERELSRILIKQNFKLKETVYYLVLDTNLVYYIEIKGDEVFFEISTMCVSTFKLKMRLDLVLKELNVGKNLLSYFDNRDKQ